MNSPVLLAAPSGTWDKQAMAETSTAQIKDGKLYMAGRNNEGGLGQGDKTQRSVHGWQKILLTLKCPLSGNLLIRHCQEMLPVN